MTCPAPGKVLVVVGSNPKASWEVQYDSKGKLDPTFGQGGVQRERGMDVVTTTAVTSDGKILLANDECIARTLDQTPSPLPPSLNVLKKQGSSGTSSTVQQLKNVAVFSN